MLCWRRTQGRDFLYLTKENSGIPPTRYLFLLLILFNNQQKPGAEPPARFVLSALCFPAGSCSKPVSKNGAISYCSQTVVYDRFRRRCLTNKVRSFAAVVINHRLGAIRNSPFLPSGLNRCRQGKHREAVRKRAGDSAPGFCVRPHSTPNITFQAELLLRNCQKITFNFGA